MSGPSQPNRRAHRRGVHRMHLVPADGVPTVGIAIAPKPASHHDAMTSRNGQRRFHRAMRQASGGEFRRVGLWKRDFGYFVPTWIHRGADGIQVERRRVLARSRNHLLSHALHDEEWVLWLDVDVVAYPPDIIEQKIILVRSYAPGDFDECNDLDLPIIVMQWVHKRLNPHAIAR
jgi:hypothetical protein